MGEIPFYHKTNLFDCGCAPVCMRMALAAHGVHKSIEEVYRLACSMGFVQYTLPWGMCLAAADCGLTAAFISKQPDALLAMYYPRIAAATGLSVLRVQDTVESQNAKCRAHDQVTLRTWSDRCAALPRQVVTKGSGVVIPTVWWQGIDAHNIVLTRFARDQVFYHDPNLPGGAVQSMPETAFATLWQHPNTDNDLLVVSRTPVIETEL